MAYNEDIQEIEIRIRTAGCSGCLIKKIQLTLPVAQLKERMESLIENDYIICGACKFKFERSKEYTSCSNCFVCTGCEIYYCPHCDKEIIITPVRDMYNGSKPKTDNKDGL